MKIFLICSFLPSVLNFRKQLILDLIRSGFDVVILGPPSSCSTAGIEKIKSLGCTYLPIEFNRGSLNPFSFIYVLSKFFLLIKSHKPDILLPYTFQPVLISGLCTFLLRSFFWRKISFFPIITGLGYLFSPQFDGINRIIFRFLLRISLTKVSCIFFQNIDDLRHFQNLSLISFDTSYRLLSGSGVDLTYYAQTPIPPDSFNVLMLSRLLRSKGVLEFLNAARTVKATNRHINFILAGSYESSPDSLIYSDIEPFISDGSISYVGDIDDVRPYLRNCSVYTLPSYREGTPRSVLEAMATGRPIITTDVPGCRETVINMCNGCIVQPRDVTQLVTAIYYLFNLSLADLVSMGNASRSYAETKFDERNVSSTIVSTILNYI